MKRIFPISILLLVLIAAFSAYSYFKPKQKDSVWNDSWYQPDQFASSAVEPLCEVEIPILINETGNSDSKLKYITWQSMLLSPVPIGFRSGSRGNPLDEALTFEFEKTCPTAFNYLLLYDLYPDHVREPFFKHNQKFEEQSTTTESSPQHCELTVSLPNIYEEFQERLTQHLKLRLTSFKGVTTVNPLDGHTVSAQLSFNSTCDQVLADYLIQDLLPADYFQMTQ